MQQTFASFAVCFERNELRCGLGRERPEDRTAFRAFTCEPDQVWGTEFGQHRRERAYANSDLTGSGEVFEGDELTGWIHVETQRLLASAQSHVEHDAALAADVSGKPLRPQGIGFD